MISRKNRQEGHLIIKFLQNDQDLDLSPLVPTCSILV